MKESASEEETAHSDSENSDIVFVGTKIDETSSEQIVLKPHYDVMIETKKVGLTLTRNLGKFKFIVVSKVSNDDLIGKISLNDVLIAVDFTIIVGLEFSDILAMLRDGRRPLLLGFWRGERVGLTGVGTGDEYLKQKYLAYKNGREKNDALIEISSSDSSEDESGEELCVEKGGTGKGEDSEEKDPPKGNDVSGEGTSGAFHLGSHLGSPSPEKSIAGARYGGNSDDGLDEKIESSSAEEEDEELL